MAADENLPAKLSKDSPGQMDLALAREFLDVTRKDMELKAQDLSLRKEAQTQSHEYALQSLTAMATDRTAGRTHQRAAMLQYLIFAGIVLLLILTFAGLALYLKQEAIVMEGLKIVGTFVGGLGAGAFFGYRKGQKDTIQSGSNQSEEE
ncbi:MAG TPA: hypothetical protein VHO24_12150 [Opitutaceae bacterium]|nr:hypothetical protein [Opitutaceae bacterium]